MRVAHAGIRLRVEDAHVDGAAAALSDVVGLETAVVLYSGRPVPLDALREPAMVERNDLISLIYSANGLEIRTEGRALERAALGKRIRAMNLPNLLTLARILLVPIFALIYVLPGASSYPWAAAFFGLAALTDWAANR